MKTVFIIGKVFSSPQSGDNSENTASVDADGTVRVHDWKFDTMTTCHSLTEKQEEKIREARPYSTVKI